MTVEQRLAERLRVAEEKLAKLRELINSDFPDDHIYKEAIHAYADGYETGYTNAMVRCRRVMIGLD